MTIPPDSARLHAIVAGSVQGVGFRAFVFEQAIRLNLKGWVRNQWSGNVEVLVEGPHATLDTFLALLRQGPRLSHVDNVQVEWLEAKNEFADFFVAKTQ